LYIRDLSFVELSKENQDVLKFLIAILHEHNIREIQLYGSYVIFLASLRLEIPKEQIRPPSDLDLRVEIDLHHFSEHIILFQALYKIGFVLKGFESAMIDKDALQKFINEKIIMGGYLNLSRLPSSKDKKIYEMEVTITFKDHYRANYNPFTLLRHYVKIKNNEGSFDGEDIGFRTQLAHDIIEKMFAVDVYEIMNPKQYNVFNFFPRLLKNKKSWESYCNMASGNMNTILHSLPLIQEFFNIRFTLHKQKECYLELVGIITQNQFSLPETELIIKGFLFALFKVINLESKGEIGVNIFNIYEMEQDVNEITRKLQQAFVTFICVVHGDKNINKHVFKKFYNCLMEILIQYKSGHPNYLKRRNYPLHVT